MELEVNKAISRHKTTALHYELGFHVKRSANCLEEASSSASTSLLIDDSYPNFEEKAGLFKQMIDAISCQIYYFSILSDVLQFLI